MEFYLGRDGFLNRPDNGQFFPVRTSFVQSPIVVQGATHLLTGIFLSNTDNKHYLSLNFPQTHLNNSITSSFNLSLINLGSNLVDLESTNQLGSAYLNITIFNQNDINTQQISYGQLFLSQVFNIYSVLTNEEYISRLQSSISFREEIKSAQFTNFNLYNKCYLDNIITTLDNYQLSFTFGLGSQDNSRTDNKNITSINTNINLSDNSNTSQTIQSITRYLLENSNNSRTSTIQTSLINSYISNQDSTRSALNSLSILQNNLNINSTSSTRVNIYTNLLSQINNTSNTNSALFGSSSIQSLVNNIYGSLSRSFYDLDIFTQNFINLESIFETKSDTRGFITLNLRGGISSSSNSAILSNISLLQRIENIITSRTSQFGTSIKNIGFNLKDSTESFTSVNIGLNISVDTIVSVLSALEGFIDITQDDGANGEIIAFMAYIKLEDTHNMTIFRRQDNNLYVDLNKNFNLERKI